MKTILITGANSGIGRATAIELKGKYFEKCKVVVPKNEYINSANQKLLREKSAQFSGLNV